MNKDLRTGVSIIGTGLAGAIVVAVAVHLDDGMIKQQSEERAQQAAQWDGRTPLQCFYASGNEQTVRVDGFDDLRILDMRERIAGGDCKASAFKPTAG